MTASQWSFFSFSFSSSSSLTFCSFAFESLALRSFFLFLSLSLAQVAIYSPSLILLCDDEGIASKLASLATVLLCHPFIRLILDTPACVARGKLCKSSLFLLFIFLLCASLALFFSFGRRMKFKYHLYCLDSVLSQVVIVEE